LFLVTALALFLAIRGRKKSLAVSVLILWGFVTVAPIGHWLLSPLESTFAPPKSLENIKGIIVLGGGQQLGPLQQHSFSGFGQHSGRVIAALTLSQQHNLPIFFIGGSRTVGGTQYLESQAISQLHHELAISTPLTVDDGSKNTFENALVAKNLLALESSANFLLITSAAHMPRAINTFDFAGVEPTPYPVNYLGLAEPQWFSHASIRYKLNLIDYAAHEWLGLVQYYVLGRSATIFPKNDK